MRLLCCAAGLGVALAPGSFAQFNGFSGPTYLDAQEGVTDVALADLDGDGDLDIAASRFTPNTFDDVAIFLNNGNGTFSAPGFEPLGSSPVAVATADVDGDGDIDVATANSGTDDFSVLRNNGDGTFAPEVFFGAGTSPEDLVLADFNRDGDIDVAVANLQSDDVSIFFGDGSGTTFEFQGSLSLGGSAGQPKGIAAADLNGDTAIDLLVTDTLTSNVSVLYNNGDGTFFNGDFALLVGVPILPFDVAPGDFNNDGLTDFATSNGGPNNVTIRLNDGVGEFPDFTNGGSATVGDRPVGLAAGDMNNDGKLDVVSANEVTDNISVLLGDGSGNLSSEGEFPAGNSPNPLALGDLDNDGDLDAAVPNLLSDEIGIYLNNTNTPGGVTPVVRIDAPAPLDCVCDSVSIEGVADVPGGMFDSFVVEQRSIDEEMWTTIATGNTPIEEPGDVLAVWDTSGIDEGFHYIRVTANNTSGGNTDERVLVWVSQDFDALDFIMVSNAGESVSEALIVGGNACPYGTVNDNRCGPDEYAVEFAPEDSSSFQPVDPANPTFSGGRINENLAIWDTRMVADGDYDVRVTAMNGCGDTAEQTQFVEVDNTAPVARIDSPVNCDSFTPGATIQIQGEISDENLGGWTLQYTGGDTNSWTTIASGNSNVDGVIAEWDTSGLPSCAYTLRLRASDQAVVNCSPGGNSSQTLVSIDVRCAADLTGDGVVGAEDLANLLTSWGSCP